MNTENSKTSESHQFKKDLTDKLNAKDPKKNIKSKYNNNKLKILAPTWDDTYLMNLILLQIFKITSNLSSKNMTQNPPVQIYPNIIKNRIIFKIKTGYKLELSTPEMMKLLGSTKKAVDKDKNRENVRKLESAETILVYCNLIESDYQHISKVLFTFVPDKEFRQLINISPHSLIMVNTVNTEFSSVDVWFTDQASKSTEN